MKIKTSLIVIITLWILSVNVQAKTYPITWNPKGVEQTLGLGGGVDLTATLVSKVTLNNVDLWIVPELQPFLSLDQTHFETVQANTPYQVTLQFSIPFGSVTGLYDGTIHVRVGTKTYPQALKVDLNVVDAAATIGPEGGVLEATLADGTEVSIAVPEGALDESTVITCASNDEVEAPSGSKPIGPAINLGPDGIVFEKPATLILKITQENIEQSGLASLEEGKEFLEVLHFNEDSQMWESLPIKNVDYSQNLITVELNHFSLVLPIIGGIRVTSFELRVPVKKNNLLDFQVEIKFGPGSPEAINVTAVLNRESGDLIGEDTENVTKPGTGDPVPVTFDGLLAPNQEQFATLIIKTPNKPLWEQGIVIDYDTVVSDPKYVSLIQKHRPILEFAPGETYYPTFVNNVFGHGSIQCGFDFVDNPEAHDLATKSAKYSSFEFNGEDTSLQQNPETVYATAVEKEGQLFIFYIFYYHYDPKSPDWPANWEGWVTQHHGDTERIVVVLDENGDPVGVAYGQHVGYELPEIEERITSNSGSQSWGDGGVFLPWDTVKKQGQHPYVYVAEGSHACYPRRDQYNVAYDAYVATLEIDEQAGGGAKWRTCDYKIVLLPRMSEIDINGAPEVYNDLVDDVYGTISTDYSFLLFSGKWGAWANVPLAPAKAISHKSWWLHFSDWIDDLQDANVYFEPKPGDGIWDECGCHKFDTDCDGCISITELMVVITKWKAGEVSIEELIEAIGIWKGCTPSEEPSDDFEDGVIDSSLWAIGGAKRGWDLSNPSDTGSWNYSHEEITDPIDGYLNMRVWGPTSGNTYGAEAWVRTNTDFNDGINHIINFTWEPEFIDYHYNTYFIQVTDGYISPENTLHWALGSDYAGTVNLLREENLQGDLTRGWIFENEPSPGKLDYSITIDPSGVARLYDSPNATGTLIYESALDLAYPWYVRFMVSDGTSAGFPAGDARLKLYSFSPVP